MKIILLFINIIFFINIRYLNSINLHLNGDWGLGIGDWGLGIGDWDQSPIAKPQSPTPNPPIYL